jgi:FlaA1/EpsC-like NDP-sugar epimerase
VADKCIEYGAEKMVMVSTDKAVNPTNIMGCTKRLAEIYVQALGLALEQGKVQGKTKFVTTRFGNVLGSNGSVIPLFKRQIANGGPVTITDKRIIRYFMTIPEASSLVMQAGAMAKKGELFVLDMGKPVRIYELAKNMITLSGFEPEVDIKIEEIGLRPGEKLYEELLMKNETLDKTDNNMIFIERDAPFSREEVDRKLEILKDAVVKSSEMIGSELVKKAIIEVVPTFHEPEELNDKASSAEEMKAVESN